MSNNIIGYFYHGGPLCDKRMALDRIHLEYYLPIMPKIDSRLSDEPLNIIDFKRHCYKLVANGGNPSNGEWATYSYQGIV